ncbi:MAG: trypsin-like serine protease [Candidatus Dojkabacteria bacterium]
MNIKAFDPRITTTVAGILAAGVSLFLALVLVNSPDLSPEESGALVNGRLETGYDYVGYLLSDNNKLCAATLIDSTTVLTAAHCLNFDAGRSFSFGTGEFSFSNDLTEVEWAKFHPQYDLSTGEGPDVAIAKLSEPIELESYPEIADPIEKCEVSIVAYGAGVKDAPATEDLISKKAGEGCIRGITSNFLITFEHNVGMCFGDSGGPLFSNPGSSELVGVLVGGLVIPDLQDISCDPGNTGLAMNASFFSDLINARTLQAEEEFPLRIMEDEQDRNIQAGFSQFLEGVEAADFFINLQTSGQADSNTTGNSGISIESLVISSLFIVTLLIFFVLVFFNVLQNKRA